MSMFDAKPKPAKGKKKSGTPDRTWDILSLVMVVVTLSLCLVFMTIFSNPYTAINPFKPPTPLPTIFVPTATITPIRFDATWTTTPTLEPTATNTPRPTITLEPTNTLFVPTSNVTATNTPKPTVTPRPTGVPFAATISNVDSTTYNPGSDCTWFGVAGQVLDANNNPVIGSIIKLGGSVPGKTIYPEQTSLSGIAPAYGQSGFEFKLDIAPVASKNSLWVQLYDQSGSPISDQVYVTTSSECSKNLVFVRFKKK